jgi:NADH:ubiquinone oxidoreductase subunit 6 (subunit J)
MSFWICSAVAVGAAIAAAAFSDLRRAVLALWVTGLGVGGIYLSLGAELLAVVQWSVSTIAAISFFFYATLFGELGVADDRPARQRALACVLPGAAGLAFAVVVVVSAQRLLGWTISDLVEAAQPAENQTLARMGRRLVEGHLPALQVLGFLLFLVVIGAGALARPEVRTGADAPPRGDAA